MLIPQFSLRWLLAVMTAASVVFLIVSFAARGHYWAVGASIGFLSLAVALALYGVTFYLVWLFATITGRRRLRKIDKLPIAFFVFAVAHQCLGAGTTQVLPVGKPAPNGITLTVDTTWAEGYGYRPVTFTANCAPPSNADRTLSFELRYHDWNANSQLLTARCDLEIPAGSAMATRTIAVPHFCIYQGYSLDVWEDGRHVPELSAKNLVGGAAMMVVANEAPAILFISSTQPNVQTLSTLFPVPQYMAQPQVQPGAVVFPQQWGLRAPTALPDQWLCYQNLDLILIASTDLQLLATNSPRVLSAIRDWVKAGGNLLVYDAADEAGLAKLEELLRLPAEPPAAESESRWTLPTPANYRDGFADIALPGQDVRAAIEVDENGNVLTGSPQLTSPTRPTFSWCTFQQGTVVAIEAADPFAATTRAEWHWIFNTLGSGRWLAVKRTGASFESDNSDFWMFLIPGVGGAPVDAYRVLITIFVVLIGPVNYLLLRKHGRLHLLLFTVPASALVVTLCLLGYALVADGLHTRVRSRSFTMLDQRTNDCVSWSRIAYYSGLAPSSGLNFTGDIAAIPYEQLPVDSGGRRVSRTIDALADANQLKRGWLPSRTPTQLLTVRPDQSAMKLVVRRDGESISVENQLGVAIRHLVLQDEPGVFAGGSGIAAGKSAQLVPVLPDQPNALPASNPAVGEMRKAFADHVLALPSGFTSEPKHGLFGFRHRRYYYGQGDSIPAAQSTSRLETGIEFAKAAVLQAGVVGDSNSLVPKSYVAIVDRPERISLGLNGVTETEGFHVIRGNW